MATVLTPPPAAPSKQDARLEQELRKVAGRIRLNDVLVGVFALAVVVLGYAVVGVLLDQWLELPGWARQAGLGAFALTLAAAGYVWLVRPFRWAVNPRFAARQVEATVPDAKNAVINWVDLHDQNLPDGVRRAVVVQAAEGITHADTTKVAESRAVVWLGGTAGLLVAVLAVLFVVLKPAPFLSLLGRTFNPFSSGAIATRTTITLTEPRGGDATVTSGDTFVVAAYVDGSVPDAGGPARVRLQVRYNPESPEYDEMPLDPGTSNREWQIRVPQHVIQNGFWYRVAGGDGRTPEHRLTVRSRPLVRVDRVRYEYPAYTRMTPEEARDPVILAYRGTEVTVTARTNRPAKSGSMRVAGFSAPIPAEVVGEGRDELRFRLTLAETGTYQIDYTTDGGEASDPSPLYPITVLADQPPTPTISTPADEEITKPANGLLEVDGAVGDDFGIESVALVIRVQGATRPLLVKKYRDGLPLRREADGTVPTGLEYKDSVPLALLNTTEKESLGLATGTVLEYWLEATDNCAVPQPNVGRSAVKRIRLTEPEKEQPKKDTIAQQRKQRQAAEQQHQQQQDEQFRNENRNPKQLHPDNPEPKQEKQEVEAESQEGNPQGGDPQKAEGKTHEKNGTGTGEPSGPKDAGMNATDPQNAGGMNSEQAPMPRPEGQPTPPESPNPQQGGTPDPGRQRAPDQKSSSANGQQTGEAKAANDRDIEKQAEKVRNALNEQEQQPGEARKPDAGQQQPDAPPADPNKGAPREAGTQPEQKPELKSGGMEQERGAQSSESKGAGQEQQPNAQGASPENKGTAGQERPALQDSGAQQPGTEERAGDARGSKPATPAAVKPTPKPGSDPNPTQSGRPGSAAESKPMPSPDAGAPMGERNQSPDAAKPEGTKAAPNQGTKNAGQGSTKGAEKPTPSPDQSQSTASRGGSNDPVGGLKPKMDPKEFEQAMNDLAGNDDAKQQAARDKLDETLGPDGRQRAEQAARDMKSNDQQTRERGKQQAGELSREIGRDGNIPPPPDEKVERLLRDKVQDLASNDLRKREAAEREIDQAAGKGTRDELQKAARNLNSTSPQEKQAAAQKVDELAKKAGHDAGARTQPTPPKNGGDQTAGQPKSMNQEARQSSQGNQHASGHPPEHQGANPQELTGSAAGGGHPQMEKIKELAQKANNLNSSDESKRRAAEKEFDQIVGEQKRKELQKDLASGNMGKQQAAQEQLADLAKEQHDAARPDPKNLSPEQREQAAKQLEKMKKDTEDLASKDQKTREAAEKKFDAMMGKENREQLQKDMEDLKSGNPNREKAAKNRIQNQLDQMANEERQSGGQDTASDQLPKDRNPGGLGGKGPDEILHKDDPKNRLKSAVLQLSRFEKNKHNKELHDKLGMTPEEYDRFVEGFRRRVAELRDDVAKGTAQSSPPPTGRATQRIGEGTGGRKLEALRNGAAAQTSASGPGTAPPGYSDAQRRFAEEAAKLRQK